MSKTELITSLLAALMRHEIYPTISDEELDKMTMDYIVDFMVAEAVNVTRSRTTLAIPSRVWYNR